MTPDLPPNTEHLAIFNDVNVEQLSVERDGSGNLYLVTWFGGVPSVLLTIRPQITVWRCDDAE